MSVNIPPVSSNKRLIAAVTADCHLKPYTWATHPELHGDSFRSFDYIVVQCLKHHIPLFILGDLFDLREPGPVTIGYFMDKMNLLEAANVPVYFIQGQHELNRSRPWAACHKHPQWINGQHINIGGLSFYALDFTTPDRLQAMLGVIDKKTDILLAHQVWRERMGVFASRCEGSFTDIPHVKMVISGDFHSHKVTQHKGKDGQDLQAVSPGSTYMKTLDEAADKYFYFLYEDLTLQSVQIPTRPIHRVRINTQQVLNSTITKLTTELPVQPVPTFSDTPILHVEYRDGIPEIVARLKNLAVNRAHLFLRPIQVKGGEDPDAPVIEAVENASSLEDFLPFTYTPDSAEYKGALRLLRAVNHKDELKQMTAEVITEAEQASQKDSW